MPSAGLDSSAVMLREPKACGPRYTIAIIGAGFSGTMTAIHLRRALPATTRILLIERSGVFARGIAFAQTSLPHLLNVRAANMSAFPDDPGHFERWLEARPVASRNDVHRTEAGLFVARRLYGRYLQETLDETLRDGAGSVQLLTDEVDGLARTGTGWRLHCRSGQVIEASGVVLACGNLPPESPCDGVVFHNPWTAEAMRGLNKSDPVLIVGTGLTMVDLVLGLQTAGFEGPVIALSRRGLLPQPHAASAQPWPTPNFGAAERISATALLRAVRAELGWAAAQGVGWRAVIDSLRPITAELWQGLPPCEQARLLRHVRPYWDIHRHRMAPSAAAVIAAWRAQGRLQIRRGRIRAIAQPAPGQADISITNSPAGTSETLRVQRVIYATGLQSMRSGNGLLAGLLRAGLARLDGLGLGLEVDTGLAILDASGQPIPGLWALGPLVRGKFWECLAVPDIRIQAQHLSTRVALAHAWL